MLALSDHDGNGWVESNAPYAGLPSRTAVPEQSWLLPDGTEVLVAARLHRAVRGGPVEPVAVSLRSGRGRARLDRERSDLVATVAHELRSPLTGVRGFVHALLNRWDKLNDEQKKLMLNTVAADADRLSRLIAELLDVARIDTGRLQMHTRPCDVVVLCERVVASVQHATRDPDHPRRHTRSRWSLRTPTRSPRSSPTWSRTPSGTARATSRSPIAPDPADPSVRRDHGGRRGRRHPGGPPAAGVHQVLDGELGGGSGLGLYIVNGLVRAHGGTVTIDDRARRRRVHHGDLARPRPELTGSRAGDLRFLD